MTEDERKRLTARRTVLVSERDAAFAKMNQAVGAISMVDSMLQLADAESEPNRSDNTRASDGETA